MLKGKKIAKMVLHGALISLYSAMAVTIIIMLIIGQYEFIEMKHIGTSTIIGPLISLTPVFFKRVLHIEVSLSAIVFAGIMIFLNTLGEVFNLYYRIADWDIVLHTVGGYGFTFLIFGALFAVKSPQGKAQTAIYLLAAASVSLSISALWELMEWGVDNVIGTNMQKLIPENHLFNGGSTKETLVGTDEQIAEFYRQPTGYMYALQDTMQDLFCCVIGAFIFCMVYILVGHHFPRHYREVFVKVTPKQKIVRNVENNGETNGTTAGRH